MSCECGSLTDRRFPESLGCVLNDSFSTTRERLSFAGMGNRTIELPDYKTVKISILLQKPGDAEIFWEWYRSEINGGLENFAINLPAWGYNKEHIVRFDKQLSEGSFAGSSREISATLIVESDEYYECQFCNQYPEEPS